MNFEYRWRLDDIYCICMCGCIYNKYACTTYVCMHLFYMYVYMFYIYPCVHTVHMHGYLRSLIVCVLDSRRLIVSSAIVNIRTYIYRRYMPYISI